MPRSGEYHSLDGSHGIGSLLEKLENIQQELALDGLKLEESKDLDEFTYLKKQAARQLQEARKLLDERDALFAKSTGSGGKESVHLSSKIREILREAKESHRRMQTQPTKDENDLADGKGDSDFAQQKINDQTHVIELIAKHIAECERLEKKRYQSVVSELGGGAGGDESARKDLLGSIKGDEEEGVELLEPIDPEPAGSVQVVLDEDAHALNRKLQQLNGALDELNAMAACQAAEIHHQTAALERISEHVDAPPARQH